MNEMKMRIARALLIVEGRDPDLATSDEPIDGIRPRWEYSLAATAVLAAMREPTEAMIDAGSEVAAAARYEDTSIGYFGAKQCWETMIDEALR